ncbi:unnamed protein product [Soboliphyme baturini]|uniref:ubiquitinyl hydrolase 1 n=1 Tax=Soboliphyme baturini TaxID=241478 RepID=A0A183INV9_9BILA|nr:unnamed protein product [Soboliphyme baturini]
MSFDKIPFSVPNDNSKVYKDECMYCFNTPFSEGGLFLCLVTHYGLCPKHLNLHVKKTEFLGYLHFSRVQISTVTAKASEGDLNASSECSVLEKPKEFALKYKDVWELVIYPDLFPYSLADHSVPTDLASCCQKLIEFRDAYNIIEIENQTNMWEGNPLKPTRITNLHQIENPPVVSTIQRQCQWEGCDKTDNLWMNLTDGSIYCGRRFWDGSGGRGHAIEHYGKTGYPLAVKVGTITANGADVYSYDEDEMVCHE